MSCLYPYPPRCLMRSVLRQHRRACRNATNHVRRQVCFQNVDPSSGFDTLPGIVGRRMFNNARNARRVFTASDSTICFCPRPSESRRREYLLRADQCTPEPFYQRQRSPGVLDGIIEPARVALLQGRASLATSYPREDFVCPPCPRESLYLRKRCIHSSSAPAKPNPG